MRRQEALVGAAERQQRFLIAQLAVTNQHDILGQQPGRPQRRQIRQKTPSSLWLPSQGWYHNGSRLLVIRLQDKLDSRRFAILIVTFDQHRRMLGRLGDAGGIFIAAFKIHTGRIAVQPCQNRAGIHVAHCR